MSVAYARSMKKQKGFIFIEQKAADVRFWRKVFASIRLVRAGMQEDSAS